MNRRNAKNGLGINLKDPKSFFSWMIDSIDRALVDIHSYSEYQADPIGFGQDKLGESYTDEVKILMESVRDYPVTIAISATGTGKIDIESRKIVYITI